MDADRELDALIAEQVMGWQRWLTPKFYGYCELYAPGDDTPIVRGYTRAGDRVPINMDLDMWPHYSTDIAGAWLVADHLNGLWREFHLDTYVSPGWENSGLWVCSDRSAYERTHCECIEGKGETPMLAICRAALLAVQVAH